MNKSKLKTYAPQARKDFIAAVTARANPAIHAAEKSDAPIVPKKPSNKGEAYVFEGADSAEAVEGRSAAKGNAEESTAGRTLSRESALTGLQRVRETAKRDRRLKFTALLHHVTPSLLVESFYDLNKTAIAVLRLPPK